MALFGALFLKQLPELSEPILDYARHLHQHREHIIRASPYAKKSLNDDQAASAVEDVITRGLRSVGVDQEIAEKYASTVTNAAVEARAAGRREFNGDFVSDEQVQQMMSQFS
jgi:hypothetical protein